MIQSRAVIKTSNASRYLQQLCKHWSHKIESLTYNESQAHIPFNEDINLDMFADDKELAVEIKAGSEAEALRYEGVFASHIERFAFRETLDIHWNRTTLP